MSSKNYYEDVKIIKKPLKVRIKSFFIIILFFLIFGGIFVSARALSGVLTVSQVGNTIVYGDGVLKIDERKLYAVTMGEYDDENNAEKVALGANIQGAGGYIWLEKGRYYVFGSVYKTMEEAESVQTNLKSSSYKVSIREITLNKAKVSFANVEKKDIAKIKKAVDFLTRCYEKIYDYSVKFDKKKLNNLAVSSYISNLRSECKGHMTEVQLLLTNNPDAKLDAIIKALISIDELLDQTILKAIKDSGTGYSLRYAICRIVNVEFDLRKSLM